MENSVLQHFFPATLRDFFHKVYGLCILFYRKCLENRFFLQHKVDSDIFLLSHLVETSQEFLYCFLLFFFHHRCSKNILGISVLFLLFFFPHRCTRNILGISLFFVVLFPPQMQQKHLRNISVFLVLFPPQMQQKHLRNFYTIFCCSFSSSMYVLVGGPGNKSECEAQYIEREYLPISAARDTHLLLRLLTRVE